MLIALVNLSAQVKPTEAVQIAGAVNDQLQNEYRQVWGKNSTMVAVPDLMHIPQGARPMFLLDKADEMDALGYHSETAQGVPVARIFVTEILKGAPNASVLGQPGTAAFSVSSVVSHEALEMDGNPYANLWAQGPDGFDHAREMCDAVEGSGYRKGQVLVANFVTPRWFDGQAPQHARFDYLGHLKRPFSIERGGYEIVKPSGHEHARNGFNAVSNTPLDTSYHFGVDMPQWQRNFKMRRSGRGARMALHVVSPTVTDCNLHVCSHECCTDGAATSAVSQ